MRRSFFLVFLIVFTTLVPYEAKAITYVRLIISLTPDSLGNTPNDTSMARAYSVGAGSNYSQSVRYLNNSFVFAVPKDENIQLSLEFNFGSSQRRIQNTRTFVPQVNLTTKGQGVAFKIDTILKLELGDLKVLRIKVTDSQLNSVKNVSISDNSLWTTEIGLKLQEVDWFLTQDQDYVYSKDGYFEIAYYNFSKQLVQILYWESETMSSETLHKVPSRISSNNLYTQYFSIADFQDLNLCFILNLDSSKSTNVKCFENIYNEKIAADKASAELRAKQEADARAAAELKAKQEADARAAAELKAKQDAEAKAAAELKAKQDAEAKATVKKITITCTKGKLTKKVTALKPKCPAGYKPKK
jgi:hypothetical protein